MRKGEDSQYGVTSNAPERRRLARAMVIFGAAIAMTFESDEC